MLERRVLKLLAISVTPGTQTCNVQVVESIRAKNASLIPSPISRLIASQEQDCSTARIERVENAERSAGVLNAQLPHVAVTRCADRRRVRVRERRAIPLD